jgi:hypothetical protein
LQARWEDVCIAALKPQVRFDTFYIKIDQNSGYQDDPNVKRLDKPNQKKANEGNKASKDKYELRKRKTITISLRGEQSSRE